MPSRVVHFEILSKDPQRAAKFYEEALGWKSNTWDGPQAYWLMTTGEAPEAGINGAIMARHFDQTIVNTVQVDSLEATTKKIEAAGGKKLQGPNEIPGVGTHSYFTDPDGTIFGVLQPAKK